jgi:hypothetical protein
MKNGGFTTLLNPSHIQEVMIWFKGQAAEFYDSRIQKLVPRLNKRLDNAGDYVEKIKLCVGNSFTVSLL